MSSRLSLLQYFSWRRLHSDKVFSWPLHPSTVKPHRSRPHAIIHFIYKILALVVQSEVQFNAFVAEMSAQHFSGFVFPVIATQCAPDPLVAYFYAASVRHFRTT
ncbi:hypothetical protein OS493_007584 [Desmophyllum pertusum]|uniref:Uncharacterized protein n=1 Tax=Desmophyllum pertusum TaxID=174260 RepID=A0A9W9Z3J4_9CNID|nr:hypothetical protein OS493_007584 [Desmophyllum pertusum]